MFLQAFEMFFTVLSARQVFLRNDAIETAQQFAAFVNEMAPFGRVESDTI
jgi:hypothetical protein